VKIGGFQSCTLSDFPGHVAAIVFTQGCNFRCPFCHNGQLISTDAAGEALMPEDEVMQQLESRRKHIDGVVITGGEPTLQPDLPDFIRNVRNIRLAVKLDTNGSSPKMLRRLLDEHLLDFVAMDVKAPTERYAALAGVDIDAKLLRESMSLIVQSGIAYEFRTTVVPALLSTADIDAIRRELPFGASLRLQKFKPEHALASWLRRDDAHGVQMPASNAKNTLSNREMHP
jgi:pyruvate formate lyase activating enzyme